MKVAILGVGAYGIALAKVCNQNKNTVVMWAKFKEEADIVLLKRENAKVLPGVKIDEEIEITTDLAYCVKDADVIILAVPMGAVRSVSKELSEVLEDAQTVCIVSKGIENATNKLMSQVVFEETKSKRIGILSGPSFAIDLIAGTEIGLVVASTSEVAIRNIKVALENEVIVLQETSDVIGTQIAAAVKNVFAIFMGMLEGMGQTDSTKAAILTCLVRDLKLIIEVMGGKSHTIFSYAAMGDLLLTCMSSKSRNYTLGNYIGQGYQIEEALQKMGITTVEGLYTLNSIISLLEEKEIEIKSIRLLYDMIYQNKRVEHILRHIKR